MLLTRWTITVLAAFAVLAGCIGVGLGAHLAFAESGRTPKPRPVLVPQSQDEKASDKPPDKKAEKPLRVLLFADAASREYQFVRALFIRQMDKRQAELSICLQTGGRPGIVQDVPPERLLKRFPTRMTTDETEDAEDRHSNLEWYDVVIAFDPDWSQLTEKQGQFLEKWVAREGRGLILVAGPANTPLLGRPGTMAQKLKPILDLLPVRVQDDRAVEKQRDTSRPWPLSFPAAEEFLQLAGDKKDPLAGWSEFFYGKKRDDWQKTEDEPVRGFYSASPVKSLKQGAVVHAAFRDPASRIDEGGDKRRDLPYLVTMSHGKGRTIYVGSSETWRLRQFREECHERFWTQLARHAAGRPVRKP